MIGHSGTTYRLDAIIDSVSEKEKLEITYLKGNVDKAITDLVYDKRKARIAFNTYLGKRDDYEMQHLADNYGVGSPTDIPSMRLMARRINSLVGKHLQNHLDYYVTCSNETALDLKLQQRKSEILNDVISQAQADMQNNLKSVLKGGKDFKDVLSQNYIEELQAKYNESWQADFEIAAQDYCHTYTDKKELKEKFKEMYKHLAITGEMYNRIWIRELGKHPEIMVCDPRELFYEVNPNSMWIEDCRRVVYRMYMSPTEIINKLGHLMEDEDRAKVAKAITTYYQERYSRETVFVEGNFGEQVALVDTPRYEADLIEVYHTEWLATNEVDGDYKSVDGVESKVKNIRSKKRYRTDRYEGYRIEIGGGIYVGLGKSKWVTRSEDNPNECKLSYNGLQFNSNYNEPYSLILATKDIGDIYDLTCFHLNNLLASARPGGTYTVLEHLPKEFGDTPEERLLKNTGFEKTLSQKLISLSQEGMEAEYQFNNYGNYPSNLDGTLVQAFIQYLDNLEQQADKIVGLNQRILGDVEERDGKAVTMQAISQGELITKEMYHLIGMMIKKSMTNIVNTARISLEGGYMGSYSLGTNHKIFSLDAETFSMADYNVFIVDDFEEFEIKGKVDALLQMAIQNQMVDMKTAFSAMVSKSVSEKKQLVERAERVKNQSAAAQLQELQAQLEELTKENEKLQKEVSSAGAADTKIKQEELNLKKQKMIIDKELKEKELETKKEKVEKDVEIDKQKIQAELLQLHDSNKGNDEINWNK